MTENPSADVYDDIRAERESHAERGWDDAHDDLHGVHHLVTLSEKYAHRQNHDNPGYYNRDNLVKAAALMVAAIDTFDRSNRR